MSFIKIKFKRKKGAQTFQAATNTETTNPELANLDISAGEPVVYEDSNSKQYLTIGKPNNNNPESSTKGQDANYVKLQSKEKVDNVLYKNNSDDIVDDNNLSILSFPVPVNKGGTGATTQQEALSAILGGSVLSVVNGGTGKNSLTNKGVLVGNGTNAVSAVTGTNKALYFNNSSNPTAGILPGSCGGTGLDSGSFDSIFLNALKNLLGFSKVEFGNYTANNSDTTLTFSKRPKLIIITANRNFNSSYYELSPLIVLDYGREVNCQVFSGYDNGGAQSSNAYIRSSSLIISIAGEIGTERTTVTIPKTQPFGSIDFYPFVNARTDYRYVAIL